MQVGNFRVCACGGTGLVVDIVDGDAILICSQCHGSGFRYSSKFLPTDEEVDFLRVRRASVEQLFSGAQMKLPV